MIDTARDAASKRVFDSIKTKLFGLGIAGLLASVRWRPLLQLTQPVQALPK